MASVSFRGVEKSFGHTKVIHGIDFEIREGEFMVLVSLESSRNAYRYSFQASSSA